MTTLVRIAVGVLIFIIGGHVGHWLPALVLFLVGFAMIVAALVAAFTSPTKPGRPEVLTAAEYKSRMAQANKPDFAEVWRRFRAIREERRRTGNW